MAIILKRKKADEEKLISVSITHLASQPRVIYATLAAIGVSVLLTGFLLESRHTKLNPLAFDPPASAPAVENPHTVSGDIAAELKIVYTQAASLHAAFLAFHIDNQGETPGSIAQLKGKYLAEPTATGKEKTTWLDTWALKDGVFIKRHLTANTCRSLSPYKVFSALDYGKNGVQCITDDYKHFAYYHMTEKAPTVGFWKLTLNGELNGKLATWRVAGKNELLPDCDSVEAPNGLIELSPAAPKKTIELCIPQMDVETAEINQGLSLLENEETMSVDFVSKEKPMKLTVQASSCDSNTVSIARVLLHPAGTQPTSGPINCDLR